MTTFCQSMCDTDFGVGCLMFYYYMLTVYRLVSLYSLLSLIYYYNYNILIVYYSFILYLVFGYVYTD